LEEEFDALPDTLTQPSNDAPRGEIWWVSLDPTTGSGLISKLKKTRPCLILSANALNERRRTVVVVPLSTAPHASPPLLVPVVCAGKRAMAVTDQVRAVAKERVSQIIGTASSSDLAAVENGLRQVLELD
jgi:mRNA interferase MazF